MGDAELARREAAASARHLAARECSPQIATFHGHRKAKRALPKGQDTPSMYDTPNQYPIDLNNHTCVVAPEVMEGPYYINNEMVRYDLIEDQAGVPLTLDIGVVDVNGCKPLENVFVELWQANATGIYGSYPTTLPPPDQMIGPLVRNETFLRGGLPTNSEGLVELRTIYPGFYESRCIHIHAMFHIGYETSPNGTLVSHSGTLVHTAQFFFDDSFSDKVLALEPYSLNEQNRTLNEDDFILQELGTDGNSAFLDLELLGESVADGVLGYITVVVDSSASYEIENPNYLNSTGPDAENFVAV
ncbi:hypothetical protein VNI00_007134 [Paramarasmius palmivorus]|uniref:Intradiol ring-cleavage dioxygenases domain-containing protein n=1 Tax=Paramarasmius palmivorus TaxID=297713 RepID=A0AAW0D4A4_9AGAR